MASLAIAAPLAGCELDSEKLAGMVGSMASAGPDTLIAVLKVCFDDSGTHDGSRFALVAGLVSTVDQWKRLESEWSDVLRDAELDSFHAKTLSFLDGPFGKFKDYAELSQRLAGIIARRIKGAVAVGADPIHCAETIEAGNQLIGRDYMTVYGMSCIHAVLVVREKLTKGRDVALCFEAGTKGFHFFNQAFQQKSVRKPYGITSIWTADDDNEPALQAADLYAWELRRDILTRGESRRFPSKALLRLLRNAPPLFDTTLNVDAFKRGIDELIAKPELLNGGG